MNLKTDLVKNKKNTLITFNLTTMIILFVVLSVITILFLSKPLGIIFSIISIFYLIYIYFSTKKLKNKNENIS